MSPRPSDDLTDAQRICLRLVYTHHNSKEIAARTGVSPSAIDKRIERAVQVLGVATRFEAARLLHEHEARTATTAPERAYDRLPSESIDVPRTLPSRQAEAAERSWRPVRRFLGLDPVGVMERGARVRLTRTERFVRFVVVVLLLALASVAIVNVMMTLTTMIKADRSNHSPLSATAGPSSRPREERMLKQRRQAAELVTRDFLETERTIDVAAQTAASCVSTLLAQRAAANLPLGTGVTALQLISDASMDLIRARTRILKAHKALLAVRTEIGLARMYGDEAECPPSFGELTGAEIMKLVA